MEIITRKEAKSSGLPHYFTGKPCKHGHIDKRFVSTYQCFTCITAHCVAWQNENRDRLNEAKRAWKKANPEKMQAAAKRKYTKDKEFFLSKARNRSARKRASKGQHTSADIKRILKLQKNKCAWCATDIKQKYHVDHIEPLAKGGSNAASNLQCLCPPCNIRKSDKDPIDWAQQEGRLI